jgi:hypothetical protein
MFAAIGIPLAAPAEPEGGTAVSAALPSKPTIIRNNNNIAIHILAPISLPLGRPRRANVIVKS